MVKIKYKHNNNHNEIEVNYFEEFYNNYFDKESLTNDYLLEISRACYKDDGSFEYWLNVFYRKDTLESKEIYEINIKDGDIIGLIPMSTIRMGGGLRYVT